MTPVFYLLTSKTRPLISSVISMGLTELGPVKNDN